MSTKKCFVVLAVAVCLAATLWGQEPNDVNNVVELKMTIAKLEKQIEQQEKKIKRLREEMRAEREELQEEKEENQRLKKICREAGINVEKTEGPMEVDYEVCQTPIEPNVLSDSMKTLGFTKLEVGELGWIDRLYIEQVIDANNAIVRINETIHQQYDRVPGSPGVVRVNPSRNYITYDTVWLKGVQTEGWADDARPTINHHFVITGTKTYDTAIGSHTTLYVIEPVILSPKRLKQETLRYEDLKKQWSRGEYGLKDSQKPVRAKRKGR